MAPSAYDVLLVGGGLQSALIALALVEARPGVRIAVVEAGAALGGNHTWSFHAGDVPPDMAAVVERLVEYRSASYDVRFPDLVRSVPHSYATFTGSRVHSAVTEALARPGCAVILGSTAALVAEHEVQLSDGRSLTADLVVDARGPGIGPAPRSCGFQKFVGLEVVLAEGSAAPPATLMDATVPQIDGFRFVYTLPFGRDRCLIEDTYYSDSPHLDRVALWDRVLDYARARGLRVRGVVREEFGVLPLPWAGEGPRAQSRGPLRAGYLGQWFHPATGYSLPIALRLARHIAHSAPGAVFDHAFTELAAEHVQQSRFCHVLNRLLFLAMDPEQRWRALSRFYQLPDDTIQRFYALTLTHKDRRRILLGRPPKGISLRGVLAAMEAR